MYAARSTHYLGFRDWTYDLYIARGAVDKCWDGVMKVINYVLEDLVHVVIVSA